MIRCTDIGEYKLNRKQFQLRGKLIIRLLFQQGRVCRGKHLQIVYLAAAETKILFAVSKRVKSKPERNRIKRRLREVFRLHRGDFQPKHCHLGVVARPTALNVGFSELSEDFLGVMSNIDLP